MAIFIKNDEQIAVMRESCRICAGAHAEIAGHIRPGVSTRELDSIADKFIRRHGAKPSFLGYRGFPASICTSVNDEVIHGIPGGRTLRSGDIVSIDIGVYYKRFHGDAARTYAVGEIRQNHRLLMDVTKQAFFEGVKYVKAGVFLHDVSAAIGDYVGAYGFGVVQQWCGHGVGSQLHEDPQIPHTRQDKRGPRLKKGMTLAIEPMVNEGTFEIKTKPDTWTVVTKDGTYSAHYENTVLVTDGEAEILTL